MSHSGCSAFHEVSINLKKALHFEGDTYFDLNVKWCNSHTNIYVIYLSFSQDI